MRGLMKQIRKKERNSICLYSFYTILLSLRISFNENHDIAVAMSPSRADPVLPWLGVFKCLYQSHCTVWGYLNI